MNTEENKRKKTQTKSEFGFDSLTLRLRLRLYCVCKIYKKKNICVLKMDEMSESEIIRAMESFVASTFKHIQRRNDSADQIGSSLRYKYYIYSFFLRFGFINGVLRVLRVLRVSVEHVEARLIFVILCF